MPGSSHRSGALLAALALAGFLFVPEAECQQYSAPGSLTETRLPRREAIAKGVAEARWQLGGLRLDPWLSLSNLSYVNDVFSGSGGPAVSDFTASVGAGLRAYLPVGQNTTLGAYALPEYVWWRDQKDRRQVIGRYGAGVFSYFNRLTVEITGSSNEQQRVASPEFNQLAVSKLDQVEGLVELRAVHSLWLTAALRDGSRSYDVKGLDEQRAPAFNRLDRDEQVARFGARVTLAGSWKVGAGIESSTTEFKDPTFARSNSGDYPYLTVDVDTGRHRLAVEAVAQQLDPEPGSEFVPFDELTGTFVYELEIGPRLTASVYASRLLSYSLLDDYAYTYGKSTGVSLDWEPSRRTRFSVSAEQGEERYTLAPSSTAAERLDDVTGSSFQAQFRLHPKVALSLGFTRSKYDSNLDRFDRSFDQVTTSISLGGLDWP
ncbi:MAG: hypothetical protein KDD11_21165 [Acidobacteria bacterium]|nr:hypothetical protein [Acidobacteriota bacterium]